MAILNVCICICNISDVSFQHGVNVLGDPGWDGARGWDLGGERVYHLCLTDTIFQAFFFKQKFGYKILLYLFANSLMREKVVARTPWIMHYITEYSDLYTYRKK